MARTKKADTCPLSPEQITTAGKLYGLGLNYHQLAAFFGTNPRTWANWVKRWPAIREALNTGQAEATQKVAATLFKMATNGKNTAATIFWLKARQVMSDYKDFQGKSEADVQDAQKTEKIVWKTQWGSSEEPASPGMGPAKEEESED